MEEKGSEDVLRIPTQRPAKQSKEKELIFQARTPAFSDLRSRGIFGTKSDD